MNNVKICYKAIELPEKHLYKSESNRHEKLLTYLRNVVGIREVDKVYELGVFLNMASDKNLNDSLYEPISYVKSSSNFSEKLNSLHSPLRSPSKNTSVFKPETEKANEI